MSCGQIGGMGFNNSRIAGNQCECELPHSCLNCYRWWDAQAIEAAANNGIYLGTANYIDLPQRIYERSPYNERYKYL